ncbi:phosphatase PAP2 family protein [Aliamphritea spongicola]
MLARTGQWPGFPSGRPDHFCYRSPLFLSLKQLIKRNRPCDYLSDITPAIQPADRFSFPSGHAAAAFAFASVLSIYYPGLSEAASLSPG